MLAGDSPFARLSPDPCKKITGTYHIYSLGGDQSLHFVPSPLLKSKVYIINETTKKSLQIISLNISNKSLHRPFLIPYFGIMKAMKHKLIDLVLSVLTGLSFGVTCLLIAYVWFPKMYELLIP